MQEKFKKIEYYNIILYEKILNKYFKNNVAIKLQSL